MACCAGIANTMLDDSDISSTRHGAPPSLAGALASLAGHAEIYVSGGAEHQGPGRAAGRVALIVTRPRP